MSWQPGWAMEAVWKQCRSWTGRGEGCSMQPPACASDIWWPGERGRKARGTQALGPKPHSQKGLASRCDGSSAGQIQSSSNQALDPNGRQE